MLLAGSNRTARLVAVDVDSVYLVGTGLNGNGVTGVDSIPFVERRRKDTGAL